MIGDVRNEESDSEMEKRSVFADNTEKSLKTKAQREQAVRK